jgi:hypothetical protein
VKPTPRLALACVAAIALAGCVAALAGCAIARADPPSSPSPPSTGPLTANSSTGPSAASVVDPIGYPVSGDGRWSVATVAGPVVGHAGTLLRYRVAVEGGIVGISPDEFAAHVSAILSDPRGWTGTGRWRLQLVGSASGYNFTVYLTTPATRDRLCANGYDRYTSCRTGDRVVLNVARWVNGVPNYGAGLDVYREYMVNHETGHRLGHGHELCPGAGRSAPLMQQQTLGLHGCLANPWPIVDGRPYAGRSGQYDDPHPTHPRAVSVRGE